MSDCVRAAEIVSQRRGPDLPLRMSVLSLPRGHFRRGRQRNPLRDPDGRVPGLPGVIRCLHPITAGGNRWRQKAQVSRIFPAGDSAGDFAGSIRQTPSDLAKIPAGVSGRSQTFRGNLERSRPVSALRQLHGKNGTALPALGLTPARAD